MSMVHEKIKIGVEENGTTKLISNLVPESLAYDLVEQGGDEFVTREGLEIIKRLRAADPDKNFIVLAA